MLRNIMTLWKIVQRHTYDILSHKYSLLIILVAAATVLVSIIQFGEIWMVWSQDKYEAIFNSFSDNISGRSLQGRLCQNVPIDVVYTWVNGSDPLLLEQLQKYKMQLIEETSKHCSYADCVPSHFVTCRKWLEDEKVLRSIYLRPDSKQESEAIIYKVKIPIGGSDSRAQNWTMIDLWSSELAAAYMQHFMQSGLKNLTVHQAHWTSDGSLSNTFGDTNAIIISGFLHSTLALGERTLQKKLTMTLQANLLNFWIYEQKQLVVVQLDSADSVHTVLNFASNITIDGHRVNVSKAYLIMELPLIENDKDFSPSRFEDKEELRYSLRSLEKFAPWVRHVYLVTNGQIPYWLDLENPHLTIVTHEAIFPDPSNLPTFSSPAIESHLHRIPGLSSKFLYLNDDIMFGKEVWPDDFFTNANGQKVYLSWAVPDCSDSCPWSWVADGSCDVSCNTSDCSFDGGDCDLSAEEMVDLYDENHNILNYDDANVMGESQQLLLNAPKYNLFKHVNIGADIASDDLASNAREMNSLLDILIRRGTNKDMFKKNSTYFSETLNDVDEQHNKNNSSFLTTSRTDFNLLEKVQEAALHSNEGIELYNKTGIAQFIDIKKTVQNEDAALQNEALQDHYTPVIIPPIHHQLNITDINPMKSSNISDIKILMELEAIRSQIFNVSNYYSENRKEITANKSSDQMVFRRKLKSIPSEKDNDALLVQRMNIDKALPSKLSSTKVSDNAGNDFSIKYISKLKEANINKIGHLKKSARFSDEKYKLHGKKAETLPSDFEKRRNRLHHDLNDHQHSLTKRSAQASEKISASEKVKKKQQFMKGLEAAHVGSSITPGRKARDTFAESLLYVNRLYNQEFGFEARKVPAHMPHLIDIGIMEKLQIRFSREWKLTSSHKLRSAQDMQYAFSYFYFLMSNKEPRSTGEIFDIFDTDHSGTWSDREIRTLLTRLFELPMNYANVLKFENDIINCSRNLPEHLTERNIPTPPYERYQDSKLPVVSKSLISNCKPVVNMLKQKFGSKKKYKYEIVHEKQQDVSFKMLNSNISQLVTHLDDVRRDPKKFICLNDNLDPEREEDNAVVRAVLQDMYESLFPEPSAFELPSEFRNRFLHVSELEIWRASRNTARAAVYIFLTILIVLTIFNFFNVECHWFQRRISHSTRHRSTVLASGHYV